MPCQLNAFLVPGWCIYDLSTLILIFVTTLSCFVTLKISTVSLRFCTPSWPEQKERGGLYFYTMKILHFSILILTTTSLGNARNCDPARWFKCDDGTCVSKTWKCDGEADCTDGPDERDCPILPIASNTTQQNTQVAQATPVNNTNVLPKPEVTPATLTSMLTLLGNVIAQNQELNQEIARLNTVLTANTNATSAAMARMEERLELMQNSQCP